MRRCAALIVAAGQGSRFGAALPKQYHRLGGMAVLRRTVQAFIDHPADLSIQLVINPAFSDHYREATAGLDLPLPVPGGNSRQKSVHLGLEALAASDAPPDYVLIHDGARPFPGRAVIARVLAALSDNQGAAAALPVGDTLRRGDEDGYAAGLVERDGLWRMQTPQGFPLTAILRAHRAFTDKNFTDDVALAEAAGMPVQLVDGAARNLKITTQEDLAMAEALLAGETRTGTGFDVHAFGPGDHVMLCGVAVPHDKGLAGHSDADVGLHALVDAMLGTIGGGDIGDHFPPTDPQWKGADSAAFVTHAVGLLSARDAVLVNADITLICERPKIGPHKPAMKSRVADLLGITEDRVNIKATTTEQLGFTGRREGIAAQVVVTVTMPR